MRVIAGTFRSRRLKTVSGLAVRPTPDRLRETLFNVLATKLPGKIFLDAYAGSGAVGIEAFSRGASKVVLIEKNADAIAVIHENLKSLGVKEGVIVARGSAAKIIPKYCCDIAFIDPPYSLPKEYDDSLAALEDIECPLVVAQHEARLLLSHVYGKLQRTRVLKQGDNSLTFFERSIEC